MFHTTEPSWSNITDWVQDIVDVTLERYNVSLTADRRVNEMSISSYEVLSVITKVHLIPHTQSIRKFRCSDSMSVNITVVRRFWTTVTRLATSTNCWMGETWPGDCGTRLGSSHPEISLYRPMGCVSRISTFIDWTLLTLKKCRYNSCDPLAVYIAGNIVSSSKASLLTYCGLSPV